MQNKRNPVAIWLLIGVGMIMIQVLLGGITRLTGSGLSITEWKPLLGAIPPMNETEWNRAFDQYKQIGQYKTINFDFTLSDFKFIYFWEWFHRQWARFMGLVFAVGFVYFILKRRLSREMIWPMALLFLLGGLQGAIGWIMVKSGLNENDLYVSHIRLAIHFVAALGLLVYVFWFALKLIVPKDKRVIAASLSSSLGGIIALLVVQLFYGAFMAGLKAGPVAPTWPDMNGMLFPAGLGSMKNDLTHNPITVQFIHRGIAYLLFFLIISWWARARKVSGSALFRRTRNLPMILVSLQVVLGIYTVVYSPDKNILLWLGVAHQFVAMLLLLSLVWARYLVRR
jgi:cytochrome c oxidase assembly protein subunit 15